VGNQQAALELEQAQTDKTYTTDWCGVTSDAVLNECAPLAPEESQGEDVWWDPACLHYLLNEPRPPAYDYKDLLPRS
jgi:hypothetical protein